MPSVTTGRILRRGLALPAIRTVGGYFASKSAHDTAWGDLLLALFTPIGSRPGMRDFGSPLHRVLFEPDILGQQELVTSIVMDTAQTWTPQVVIRRVRVGLQDKVIQLQIEFHLVGDDSLDIRLVRLDRDGVIKTLSGHGLG